METFAISLEVLRRFVQNVGPYLLIEAVMPGGTLIALLLYLYRRAEARHIDDADDYGDLMPAAARVQGVQ